MREIKFRAWDNTGKKMYILELKHLSMFSNSEYYEIMQYTGFKDKKGNEIYEGDIINRPCIGVPMLVRWNEENACFDLTREPDNFKSTMLWYTRDCHKDYEIIGNIYEHPDLLKV